MTTRAPERGPPPHPAVVSHLRWAVAIAVAAILSLASAEWHGRTSRIPFRSPRGTPDFRLASVGSAADAYGGGITIDFQGKVGNAADTVSLRNYTVVRMP